MNALELADWIENGAPFGKYETAKQAVVMLRQQQTEIEALKKNLDVALMIVNQPAKTLTDEEIHKAEYEFMYWNRSLKEPLVKLASELYVFEQAVAILRKAQENG